MSLDLQALRAKNNAQTNTASNNSSNTNSNVFSFKKLKSGDSIHIRFVEDSEENNTFWRERCVRSLSFNTIRQADGSIVQEKCYVDVPAFNENYKETMLSNPPLEYRFKSDEDLIQKAIAPYWNDTDEGKALYNKYSRKKTYIFRGFIRGNVEGYENNKLYRFIISEGLYKTIATFMDPNSEIEEIPTDKKRGLDFILNVTSKNVSINGNTQDMKSYTTSTWARKETPLTEDELKYLAETPLEALRTYIPMKPSAEDQRIMMDMFNASVADEPYDVAKWGNKFKPNNIQFDSNGMVKAQAGKVSEIKQPTYSFAPVEAPVVQPVAGTPVTESQVVHQPVPTLTFGPMSMKQAENWAEPIQAMVAQMYAAQAQAQAQTQAPDVQPVVETPVTQPASNVSSLINEHTTSVQSTDAKDLISNIMSKYSIQQ